MTKHAKTSTAKILVAFLLNLGFSVYELIGGTLTGSVAIISDSIHDLGDALSIGISYFLERKSKRQPDEKYTYGYGRYSLLGGLITTIILVVGSIIVIISAIERLVNPVDINYDGMIVLATIGVVVNFTAAWFTREGESLNQKSVNLHMLEDVLGWVVVLVGAIIMRFTDFVVIDPILSVLVALFILRAALKNCNSILDVLLEKNPSSLSFDYIREELLKIPEVEDIHHFHLWSLDGYHHFATLHVVCKKNRPAVKSQIKAALKKHGIEHSTLELELPGEHCHELKCQEATVESHSHGHAHHH